MMRLCLQVSNYLLGHTVYQNSEISTYGCGSGSSSSSRKENDAAPAQALSLKQSDTRAIKYIL
jgi:hypothetical protein